jgi:hypothetical protein
MWAVLLGVLLVLAAATSSHAAVAHKLQGAPHTAGALAGGALHAGRSSRP